LASPKRADEAKFYAGVEGVSMEAKIVACVTVDQPQMKFAISAMF